MKKGFIIVITAMLFSHTVHSQENKVNTEFDKTSIGLGLGMDYGGIGGNLLIYPQRNIGLFCGIGYAIAGAGFNAGTKLRLISDKSVQRVIPYGLLMYGYNAGIAVTNAPRFNKLFYGPTIGIGIDLKSGKSGKGYWSFGLFYPIRSSEVDAYIDDLKYNQGVEFKNSLIPIAISIGYRFVLN